MADDANVYEFLPEKAPVTEDWIKVFSSNCSGRAQAAAAAKLHLREQIVNTPRGKVAPGRRAVQVTKGLPVEGFVYLYHGDKTPETCAMDDLDQPLRSLVLALCLLFRLNTGYSANNILIQLYDAMTGIGEHPDDTSGLNKVGGGGWILSFNGVHTRVFCIRDGNRKKIDVVLEPGKVVLFKDGLAKPYTCTKDELTACQQNELKDSSLCKVLPRLFQCDCSSCKSGHRCRCELKRLNITLRHLVAVEAPPLKQKKRGRSDNDSGSSEKKAK